MALITMAAGAQNPQPQKAKVKPYALLFGTVWDAHDRAAYGVEIHIRRADKKKAQWTLYSDHQGEFAQRVPVGTADYIIWAEVEHKKGVKPVETKVHVDNDERVDFSLHLTE
jgi:hypothetical protein